MRLHGLEGGGRGGGFMILAVEIGRNVTSGQIDQEQDLKCKCSQIGHERVDGAREHDEFALVSPETKHLLAQGPHFMFVHNLITTLSPALCV